MKVNKIIQEAIPDEPHRNNSGMTDAQGLDKAYNAPNSIFIDGNKMYISGTHTGRCI